MSNDGVDVRRRRLLTVAATAMGGVGAGFTAVPFVASWFPSARAKAIGAPVEVDISKVEMGQRITVTWRGKPVWILRRTPQILDDLASLDGNLRDPNSEVEQQPEYAINKHRSIKPEFLILVGICTHLGCSPMYVKAAEAALWNLGEAWVGGFFCPCHGSRFDLSGRVFQGFPAPTNLVVPPYAYLDNNRIIIGVDEGKA